MPTAGRQQRASAGLQQVAMGERLTATWVEGTAPEQAERIHLGSQLNTQATHRLDHACLQNPLQQRTAQRYCLFRVLVLLLGEATQGPGKGNSVAPEISIENMARAHQLDALALPAIF